MGIKTVMFRTNDNQINTYADIMHSNGIYLPT